MESTWCREVELLLACARAWRSPGDPSSLEALARRQIDWRVVVQMSAWHGITPLIYRALEHTGFDGVPRTVAHQLKARFDANAVNSLRLAAHLQTLHALLSDHGIAVIPYKGPTLAAAAYGSVILRMFGDLDVLVRREQLARAIEVVRAAGFRPQIAFTAAQERILAESDRAGGFVNASGAVLLELHVAVTPRYLAARVDHRQLFENAELLVLGESQVRSFAPDALLLVLCLHGTKHLWARLLWVCDVAELIRNRPDLDWCRLTMRAGEWGADRMLRLGILLAMDLLEARPPENVRQWAVGDPVARSLAADIRARLTRPARAGPGIIQQARFHLRTLTHWRDRLQYCRYAARPSEADWGSWPLPPPLRLLYYPLRALRLLVHGQGPSRRGS
jgi:hypothetical protein